MYQFIYYFFRKKKTRTKNLPNVKKLYTNVKKEKEYRKGDPYEGGREKPVLWLRGFSPTPSLPGDVWPPSPPCLRCEVRKKWCMWGVRGLPYIQAMYNKTKRRYIYKLKERQGKEHNNFRPAWPQPRCVCQSKP